MPYFGTTPFAAPGLGVIAALIMGSGGLAWLLYRQRRARVQAEGYGDWDDQPATAETAQEDAQGPHFWLAVLPIVVVIALNYVLSVHLFPALDTSYLSRPRFGEASIAEVRGIWSIIVALSAAILLLVALNRGRIARPGADLNAGAGASVLPIFNTASLVGFGAVVAALPAFATVSNAVEDLGGGPVVSLAVSTGLLAGLTGSASGGMSIALEAVGAQYLQQARALGLSTDLLHRVTTLATGSLDALPHNGAVITLLSICGLTHRESYGDIAMVAVAIPLIALVAVVLLGSAFGSF